MNQLEKQSSGYNPSPMLSQSSKLGAALRSEALKTPVQRMEDVKYAILPSTGREHEHESNVTTTTDEHFLENDFSLPDELDYKKLEVYEPSIMQKR